MRFDISLKSSFGRIATNPTPRKSLDFDTILTTYLGDQSPARLTWSSISIHIRRKGRAAKKHAVPAINTQTSELRDVSYIRCLPTRRLRNFLLQAFYGKGFQ